MVTFAELCEKDLSPAIVCGCFDITLEQMLHKKSGYKTLIIDFDGNYLKDNWKDECFVQENISFKDYTLSANSVKELVKNCYKNYREHILTAADKDYDPGEEVMISMNSIRDMVELIYQLNNIHSGMGDLIQSYTPQIKYRDTSIEFIDLSSNSKSTSEIIIKLILALKYGSDHKRNICINGIPMINASLLNIFSDEIMVNPDKGFICNVLRIDNLDIVERMMIKTIFRNILIDFDNANYYLEQSETVETDNADGIYVDENQKIRYFSLQTNKIHVLGTDILLEYPEAAMFYNKVVISAKSLESLETYTCPNDKVKRNIEILTEEIINNPDRIVIGFAASNTLPREYQIEKGDNAVLATALSYPGAIIVTKNKFLKCKANSMNVPVEEWREECA